MRLKYDHVTNSSSVSFCAWGITLDFCFNSLSEMTKKVIYDSYLEGVDKDIEEYIPPFDEFCEDPDQYTDWFDELYYLAENDNLSINSSSYDGVIYIGKSPTDFSDDETIGRAKNKVRESLKKLGFDEPVGFINESWYNG